MEDWRLMIASTDRMSNQVNYGIYQNNEELSLDSLQIHQGKSHIKQKNYIFYGRAEAYLSFFKTATIYPN